jgi:hypothetical protein
LPIRRERQYWGTEALRVKDMEAARYRAQVGSLIEEALRAFLEATDNG